MINIEFDSPEPIYDRGLRSQPHRRHHHNHHKAASPHVQQLLHDFQYWKISHSTEWALPAVDRLCGVESAYKVEEFLEDFDIRFRLDQINECDKSLIVGEYLTGEAARWFHENNLAYSPWEITKQRMRERFVPGPVCSL